jgi:translation elongation factor aEF-1 beta
MGDVAITFRLMPEGPEIEMSAIEEKVKEMLGVSFRSMQSKPFAFGLDALFVVAVVKDEKGAADRLESALSQISGVQTVETVGLDLL